MNVYSYTEETLQEFANQVVAVLADGMVADGVVESADEIVGRYLMVINKKGRLSQWFDRVFKNEDDSKNSLRIQIVFMDDPKGRKQQEPKPQLLNEGKVLSLVKHDDNPGNA